MPLYNWRIKPMQKSKITDRKREYEIKEVQELCHTA
jgi:hypothetical protein